MTNVLIALLRIQWHIFIQYHCILIFFWSKTLPFSGSLENKLLLSSLPLAAQSMTIWLIWLASSKTFTLVKMELSPNCLNLTGWGSKSPRQVPGSRCSTTSLILFLQRKKVPIVTKHQKEGKWKNRKQSSFERKFYIYCYNILSNMMQ